MRLIHVFNLAACIACFIISVQLLLYGSIMILDPNPYIVAAEVILSFTTIILNIREVFR